MIWNPNEELESACRPEAHIVYIFILRHFIKSGIQLKPQMRNSGSAITKSSHVMMLAGQSNAAHAKCPVETVATAQLTAATWNRDSTVSTAAFPSLNRPHDEQSMKFIISCWQLSTQLTQDEMLWWCADFISGKLPFKCVKFDWSKWSTQQMCV